jgi:hypothetical protein
MSGSIRKLFGGNINPSSEGVLSHVHNLYRLNTVHNTAKHDVSL